MRTQTQFLDHASRNHVFRSHGSWNHAFRKPAFFLIAVCLCALPVAAQSVKTATVQTASLRTASLGPTAVAGESWLTHLQRSFDETSMGKTGRLGPPGASGDGTSGNGTPDHGTVLLHGSDLYRMNCRGCHGEDGSGAPPEINSVINPVRATSAVAVMERMKIAGMEMTRADAVKLAQQSKAMLLERLHHGGKDMPAFPHLSKAEVNSLIAYLKQLAGVRGAEGGQLAAREQRVRVGEHIAKSTCHICHSAAGPNPTPQQLYDGAIPPLSTLAARTTQTQFIRKITRGAPIMMGSPPELFRGRMPVFYYLSEDEAADVYLYLTRYPPYQGAVVEAAVSSSGDSSGPGSSEMGAPPSVLVVPQAETARSQTSTGRADARIAALPLLAAALVLLLLGLGLAFTVYEIRRLSAKRKGVVIKNDGETEQATPQLDAELVA